MKVNSLAPGKFERNFRHVIFKQILVIASWSISYEIALIWISPDFTDDQSTLFQVMVWCRQVTSHYLSHNELIHFRNSNAYMLRRSGPTLVYMMTSHQGLYSLSGQTSYRKVLWSFEATILGSKLFHIALKIDRHLSSSVAKVPVKKSERYDHYNTQSHGSKTSRDLAIRRLTA